MDYLPLIWTFFGIVLILVEFVVPGFIVVFFGTSALIVGFALYLGLPSGHGIPFVCFAVLCIAQVVFLRRTLKKFFVGESLGDGDLTDEFIGHEAVVVSGFDSKDLRGKVEFKGSNWPAKSDRALKPGDRVCITAREGLNLTVSHIHSS